MGREEENSSELGRRRGVGTGSETMRRVAAPMVGGVMTTTRVTLFVIPIGFVILHGWRLPRAGEALPGSTGSRESD